jgi:filamentous hemagglutinin family protein
MNHIYKTIFNRALGVWQAVSETARSQGKTGGASGVMAPRRSLLALSLAAAFGAAHAGEIVLTGQTATTLTPNGNGVTNITTATISGATGVNAFKTFKVYGPETVNLILPTNTSNLLNLVYGSAIDIQGTVNSLKDNKIGGHVIFADPHGMVVGSSGVLNVGSLTAVAPSQSFMDGVFGLDGKVSGAAVRQLLNGNVDNAADGVIRIDGVVNAVDRVRLQAEAVQVGGALNAGADALHQAAFVAAVNTHGLDQAEGMVERGGVIEIVGGQSAVVSGALSAAGGAGQGGAVAVIADDVRLTDSARIDASGAAGGGRIDVGIAGERLAATTAVDSGAQLHADATAQGDGGSVTVWGRDANHVSGLITARGGAQGGDGGFVEVSAKTGLRIDARVDTSAAQGEAGTLLIDPTDLNIVNGAAAAGETEASNVVHVGWLQDQGNTNIKLEAEKTLTVGGSDGSAANVDLSQTLTSKTLTLQAEEIVVNENSKITTGGGSVELLAEGQHAAITVKQNAVIDTGAGDITLAATAEDKQQGDLVVLSDASATVDVSGTLRGKNVTLSADATAEVGSAALSVQNAATDANDLRDMLPLSALFDGIGGGVMIAKAEASVTVHSGATIEATGGDLTVSAHASQGVAVAYSVGGETNSGAEDSPVPLAFVVAGLQGGATANIEGGATVKTDRNLNVLAHNEAALEVEAGVDAGDGKGAGSVVVGYTDTSADASIAKGAWTWRRRCRPRGLS